MTAVYPQELNDKLEPLKVLDLTEVYDDIDDMDPDLSIFTLVSQDSNGKKLKFDDPKFIPISDALQDYGLDRVVGYFAKHATHLNLGFGTVSDMLGGFWWQGNSNISVDLLDISNNGSTVVSTFKMAPFQKVLFPPHRSYGLLQPFQWRLRIVDVGTGTEIDLDSSRFYVMLFALDNDERKLVQMSHNLMETFPNVAYLEHMDYYSEEYDEIYDDEPTVVEI